jgi:hypothetical protein
MLFDCFRFLLIDARWFGSGASLVSQQFIQLCMKNVISQVAIDAPAFQSRLPGEKASQPATYTNTPQNTAGCAVMTTLCVSARANSRNISSLDVFSSAGAFLRESGFS